MDDKWITDWEPSERFPVYTRANAGEVMPGPSSPLNWNLVWEQGAALGWGDGTVEWGSFDRSEFDSERPDFVGCFGGYFYVNMSMIRVVGERTPGTSAAAMDEAFLGGHPDVPPYVAHPDDAKPEYGERVNETVTWLLTAGDFPKLREERQAVQRLRARRPDLTALSDAELVERARSITPYLRDLFVSYYVMGTSSSLGLGMLGELCADIDPILPGRIISGIGQVDGTLPAWELWDLSRQVAASAELTTALEHGGSSFDAFSREISASPAGQDFLAGFNKFVENHGARGPGEWDIRNPTWETDPELALVAIERMRLAPDDMAPSLRAAAASADADAALGELRAALDGNPEALGTVDMAVAATGLHVPAREASKLTYMMAVHEVRMAVTELGRRAVSKGLLDTPNQMTMLLDSELDDYVADPDRLAGVAKAREGEYLLLAALEEPFIINGVVPPISEWPTMNTTSEPALPGEVLNGVPGSPGTATGRARVITDPSDPRGLEPGEILVAPLTDPAWTPLFLSAAAVVVDVGAPMSHAVIFSRELGVPCVVSLTGGSSRIPDGALISVNGGTGTVEVLPG
jgi:phosphohistidine swiveling domain-containing protein